MKQITDHGRLPGGRRDRLRVLKLTQAHQGHGLEQISTGNGWTVPWETAGACSPRYAVSITVTDCGSARRRSRPNRTSVRRAAQRSPLMSHVKTRGTPTPALPLDNGWREIDATIVQRWERSPETSVSILSYADFHQHDRSFVWGCPGLDTGVDLTIGHKGDSGIPLAVAPPPPLHET